MFEKASTTTQGKAKVDMNAIIKKFHEIEDPLKKEIFVKKKFTEITKYKEINLKIDPDYYLFLCEVALVGLKKIVKEEIEEKRKTRTFFLEL
ncbi:hypothetical protein ACFLRB_01395 [Acidobacteriota bacterium]